MMPLATMPAGASGDSEPPLAPLPTMMAISSAGMPTWPAATMASGATSAADAMLPGPIDESARVTKKNISAMNPRLPRHSRTARTVSHSSVPFTWAWPNSSVTAVSVMKSDEGKPASTCSSRMSPTTAPMSHAKSIESRPTLIVVTQLTRIATTRATTERVARSMWAERRQARGYDSQPRNPCPLIVVSGPGRSAGLCRLAPRVPATRDRPRWRGSPLAPRL